MWKTLSVLKAQVELVLGLLALRHTHAERFYLLQHGFKEDSNEDIMKKTLEVRSNEPDRCKLRFFLLVFIFYAASWQFGELFQVWRVFAGLASEDHVEEDKDPHLYFIVDATAMKAPTMTIDVLGGGAPLGL